MEKGLLAKLVWVQNKPIECPLCGEVVVPIDLKTIPLQFSKCFVQIYSVCCNPKCRHIESFRGVFVRNENGEPIIY